MKNNVSLHVPTLDDYWYEQKLLNDFETMYYNAGYESDLEEYNYSTGCLSFEPSEWKNKYESRQASGMYIAYLKDEEGNFVGYVSYHYDKSKDIYVCGILIHSKERDKGYAKKGIKLLLDVARENGIKELYSCFEDRRGNINNIFLDNGFEIVKTFDWVRFNEPTKGVLVKVVL